MQIGADGLITDQFGKVLLMIRDDTRTWTIPGGAADAGELPDRAVVREVLEETGLKVMPVRLVGLYYRTTDQDEHLVFTFRCLVRGGQIIKSDESPALGYAIPADLPRPMLGIHRERIERAIEHAGGRPYWGVQQATPLDKMALGVLAPVVHAWNDIQQWRHGRPPYRKPPPWTVGAFAVIRNEDGRVRWVKRRDYDLWNLPGGKQEGGEAPWQTAVREAREETGLEVDLADLSGVYVKPEENHLVLTFTAEVTGGELTVGGESADFAYIQPGEEPANTLSKHVERVADACGPRDATIFRLQEGPSGIAEWAPAEG